ncbi:MAG: hypothetical protein QOJ15_2592 [Bradyrhizobium sp.]|nr:hypothetical protein [Bradyrhizobium sp.]
MDALRSPSSGAHSRDPSARNDAAEIRFRMSNSRYTSAFSRREAPEVFMSFPSNRREQGMPDARCTRGLVCKVVQRMRTRAYRAAEAHRHSLRYGSTAYNALSPENRALLSPSPHGNWHVGPVGLSAPPQDLTPTAEASGPHDFAVHFGAVRPARRCPLTENRPANTLHTRRRRVHRIPSQRSVTMANAPSSGTGWRES